MAVSDASTLSPGEDLTTPQYWNCAWRDERITAPAARSCRTHALVRMVARLLDERGSEPVDVLEIGCAPGTILTQLATLRPQDRLHGVDFSQPGLVEAERLLASRKVRAKLYSSDVRQFEPSQKFGVVYSCGLIEHFSEPAEILSHHVRLCAPGALVAVSVPNHRGRIQQWFIGRLDPEALETHSLDIMSVDALRQILQDTGLKEVVAGSSGRSTIRSAANRRGLEARILHRVAQAWNLTNRLGPSLSARRSVIWAYGHVA